MKPIQEILNDCAAYEKLKSEVDSKNGGGAQFIIGNVLFEPTKIIRELVARIQELENGPKEIGRTVIMTVPDGTKSIYEFGDQKTKG